MSFGDPLLCFMSHSANIGTRLPATVYSVLAPTLHIALCISVATLSCSSAASDFGTQLDNTSLPVTLCAQLMDSHPELAQALNDPALLRQSLQMAANPVSLE